MKKYIYNYYIYTNNLNYGYMQISRWPNLASARMVFWQTQAQYGACDIVKKRVYLKGDN